MPPESQQQTTESLKELMTVTAAYIIRNVLKAQKENRDKKKCSFVLVASTSELFSGKMHHKLLFRFVTDIYFFIQFHLWTWQLSSVSDHTAFTDINDVLTKKRTREEDRKTEMVSKITDGAIAINGVKYGHHI